VVPVPTPEPVAEAGFASRNREADASNETASKFDGECALSGTSAAGDSDHGGGFVTGIGKPFGQTDGLRISFQKVRHRSGVGGIKRSEQKTGSLQTQLFGSRALSAML
jgi:hypothetical protein